MRTIILFCSVLINGTALLFSQSDPLIQLSEKLGYKLEVEYHSKLEEEVFQAYLANKDVGKIEPFFCLKPEAKKESISVAKAKLDYFYAEYPKSKLGKKSLKKQASTIFDGVHELFLDKYDLEADFDDIFKNGRYNCLTASALYAIIFDHYDIPYSIKEAPTHVYLVVDPTEQQILIEATDPLTGYMNFNQQTKESYAKYLRSNRAISTQEYSQKSSSELFDQYFFEDENVSFTELAGLHYYNEGVSDLAQSKVLAALNNFEKAFILYPSQRLEFMIFATLAVGLDEKYFSMKTEARLLGKLHSLNVKGVSDLEKSREIILGKFNNHSYNLLKVDFEPEKFDSLYFYYHTYLKDSTLQSQLDKSYYYSRGSTLLDQNNYENASNYLMKALVLNPDHESVKKMLLHSLYSSFFQNKKSISSYVDSCYQSTLRQTFDVEIQKALSEVYYVARGGSYLDLSLEEKSMDYFIKALPITSETENCMRGLMMGTARMFQFGSGPDEMMEKLKNYEAEEPRLLEISAYLQFKAFVNIMTAEILFFENEKARADRCIAFFEKVYDTHGIPEKYLSDEIVVKCYWAGSSYYIRRQQYKSAKAYLLRSKKYLKTPESSLKAELNKIEVLQKY